MPELISRAEKAKQSLEQTKLLRNRLTAYGLGAIAADTVLEIANVIQNNHLPDALLGITGGLALVLAAREQTTVRNSSFKTKFYDYNPELGHLPALDNPNL